MRELTENKRKAGKGSAGALPRPRRALTFASRYVLGLLLSQCVFFGEYAPFGAAFAASAAGETGAPAVLLGAAAGYGLLLLRGDGLRYLAACLLIGVLSPLFRRLPEKGREAGVPILALLSLGAASFPAVWAEREELTAWILYASELVLAAFAAALFRQAAAGEEIPSGRRSGERMLILMLSAAAFSPVTIRGVSVGRSLLVFLCLERIGRDPSMRTGAAAGVAAGALSDACFGFTPFYSLVMALAGTFASLFRRFGKLFAGLGFVAAAAAATVWARAAGGESYGISSLLEYAAGAALTLAVPEKAYSALEGIAFSGNGRARERKKEDPHAVWIRERIGDALYQAAEAYGETAGETRAAQKSFSEELIVPAAREEVCAACEKRSACAASHKAEKEFPRLKKAMEGKAEAGKEDLSAEFGEYCPEGERFAREISRLWYAARVQKSYNARINESAALLAGEYEEIAKLLGKLSQKARDDSAFDFETEDKVEAALSEYGIKAQVIAAADARGRTTLEIAGEDLGEIARRKEHFEEVLFAASGRRFSIGRETARGRETVFEAQEKARFAFDVGAASIRRKGSDATGDYGSWFLYDDRLYLLLSDGMGSGGEAGRESARFGGMTEKLIRGGVPPETAIGAAVRSRFLTEGMVTATADLLEADLVNGELTFYKCGAAPSFVKGRDGVRRIDGGGLYGEEVRIRHAAADGGETVLMVTDGVADGLSDGEFLRAAAEAGEEDAQTLCELLLKKTGGGKEAADDRSVAALRLSKSG